MHARKEASFHADALLDFLSNQRADLWRREQVVRMRQSYMIQSDKALARWESEWSSWKLHVLFHCWNMYSRQENSCAHLRKIAKEKEAKSDSILTKALRKWGAHVDSSD